VGHSHDTVPVSPTGAQRIAILDAARATDGASCKVVDDALRAREPELRATALGALARQGRLEPPAIEEALGDPDAGVRRRAAQLSILPHLCDDHAIADRLVASIDDPDAYVAVAALVALGERADPSALEAITHAATHAAEPLVVEEAVATLGALGDPSSVSTIEALLEEAKPALRRRIVAALGGFDDPKVEVLLDQLELDRDWQVRQAVAMLRRGD
jgi:HEAT repeat protein